MKKQYQLREGEALHEWLDRLMESMPPCTDSATETCATFCAR